ncbi:zinc finger dihydrouridine synthase [Panaeolus papilionaceus]|nr:zinc finger dihydrouridine synthase [Panaeolus papilionaceus]
MASNELEQVLRFPPGTAPVKAEFVISAKPIAPAVDDDAAEGTVSSSSKRDSARDGNVNGTMDMRDLRGPSRGNAQKLTKEQKKAQRGQNKGRKFGKVRDELDLCWKVANGSVCEFGDSCRFTHDITTYLANKQPDIHIPLPSLLSEEPLFAPSQESLADYHPQYPSLDTKTVCPVFQETGECRFGFKCRFLGGHVKFSESGEMALVGDEDAKARAALTALEVNFVGADVQRALRSRKYPTPIADAYLRQLALENGEAPKPKPQPGKNSVIFTEPEQVFDDVVMEAPKVAELSPQTEPSPVVVAAPDVDKKSADALIEKQTGEPAAKLNAKVDTPDLQVRVVEKKRLEWKGKTYLAPLTTVGNLPFRRLCVDLGAEITCGEMGLATSFLSGSKEEWSLVRRHPSEKTFGVQVAGNKPHNLVPTAEVLAKELGSNGVDFVDVNCGCPIDLVFKTGSGSALLDSVGKLGKILVGMNKALGDIPLTVKLRTGVKDGKNTAHKLMPRVAPEFGVSAMTLHGRTRQQRYTRLADWEYIKQCVAAVRAREEEEDLSPIPIFGGGDCFSSQDYWEKVEKYDVDGVMIGRGALIKPWIFTEIKEKREWDISAKERLELIGKFAEYGLNHFGSDTTGVNATRRYLCEALSFQYRYVPIGLLETLPGRINDRAPAFRGRNELETLLASPDSQDWVKVSEMFLGPAPETWSFTPKHKSNAYGSEEGQG